MCFEAAASEMSNGAATSVTRWGVTLRISTISRRTGCERLAYVSSRTAVLERSTIGLNICYVTPSVKSGP